MYIGVLLSMLKKASDFWEDLNDWTPPKIEHLKLEIKPPRFFTESECDKLLEIAKECGEPIYLTVALARYGGFRKGEIIRLKWDEIKIDSGRIIIDTRKNKQFLGVPIHPKLLDILSSVPRRTSVLE